MSRRTSPTHPITISACPALCAATLLVATGCSLEPLAPRDGCGAAGGDEPGCCPAWSVPDGDGCRERAFRLPSATSGLGDAATRWVSVAVSGQGEPLAAWIEATETSGRVVVSERPGGDSVVRSPGEALAGAAVQADVAAGPDGAALVAWKQQYPGEVARVFVSERAPSGGFTDPASEGDAFSFLPTAYEPRPVFFPNGERMVVWNQWMSTGYGVAVARKVASADWQLPRGADDVLSPHYLFSNAPNPAVNARGDALIAWYQSGGASLLAWQSERFGYDGEFSRPGPGEHLSIADTPVDSHPVANPRPALSEDGHAAVVWTQEDGRGAVLVYMATRTPEGEWTRPSSLEDALSPRVGYARCALAAFAPSGDLFVIWYQDTGSGNRVFAAHRAPDGEWTEPGSEPTLVSTPGREAIFPTLAIGPKGGVLVAWTEKAGDDWVIAARRRGPAGTDWGPVEVLSPEGAGPASQPAAAIGGEGEMAIVGWSQGGSLEERAYFATVPVE